MTRLVSRTDGLTVTCLNVVCFVSEADVLQESMTWLVRSI